MKAIVFGEYTLPTYQEALAYGLEKNGVKVVRIKVYHYAFFQLQGTISNTFKIYKAVRTEKPDFIFLYRVISILPLLLPFLKYLNKNIRIFIYHNDDPYRKGFRRRLTCWMYLRCIRYSDITYVYRDINIPEAFYWGAKNVKLFMSHFDSRHDLIELQDVSFHKTNNKVVYIGHFENDSRVAIIDYLFKHGVDIHIYSDELFEAAFNAHSWPMDHYHKNVYRDEYRKTISEAAMALAFFSTKNRDKYTRRCFEIPIMGTLLLSPQTSITEQIFKNGETAILYSSAEDLYNKIQYLNSHIDVRNEISKKGYEYMKGSNHSEIARAKMVINDYNKLTQ